jgi:cytochrome P450
MNNVKRPPGPGGRNFYEYVRNPLYFFMRMWRKYGDIVEMSISDKPTYLLVHPDFIEYVLVLNHRNFIKHHFFWDQWRPVFGEGLLTSEGEVWKRQRQLSQPAFHRDRINAYAKMMVDITKRLTENWGHGEERDLHQDMMRITSQVVVKTLFGADIESGEEDLGSAFDVMKKEGTTVRLPFRMPGGDQQSMNEYQNVFKLLDEKIYKIVRRRRSSPEQTEDLLSMLMEARDEQGTGMDDRELRDVIMSIFFAGHETSALALTWTYYLLSHHPDVEQKLFEEIKTVLNGKEPQARDLQRLKYTEWVILESMRLYPPSYGFGREALADCVMNGYEVPAGTTVFLIQWVTHRDPRWFEDPEKFYPERWDNDLIHKIPRFAYFPFSGGPRLCIGNNFGMMEMILMLSYLVQTFKISVPKEFCPTPFTSISLQPEPGMPAHIERRSNI